uniref:G-protein coupled receptors family 3 profile domain-containing protein n=1 Tax=Oncorhynchus mykiss TaxID=8022 RepID=A0A8K9Y5Y3_ONCMY
MVEFILPLCLLIVSALGLCITVSSLDGDYIVGGLFQLHEKYGGTGPATETENRKPEVLQCHRFTFSSASYQQIQVMRFAIEEINNSTLLLPGVSLGYEIFDYCSDLLSYGAALDFLTQKGRGGIPVWNGTNYRPKVISVTGPFGSSQTISVAPLYMSEMILMVSSILCSKNRFPSFFRTIPSDKYQVESIVRILQQFNWNWVAFIGGNDYSRDALTVFQDKIRPANICLAYQGTVPQNQSLIGRLFNNIAMFNVQVIVVFANVEFVIPFIQKAIDLRVKEKIWIASETWSNRSNSNWTIKYFFKLASTPAVLSVRSALMESTSTTQVLSNIVFAWSFSLTGQSVRKNTWHHLLPMNHMTKIVICTHIRICHPVLFPSSPNSRSLQLHRMQKDEWARNGSTSCTKRSIEYLHSDAPLAICLMFQAISIILISITILVLFLCKHDTPVVKSAGGRLCFFMLCCLSMSSSSVFLYIGKPTEAICTLRNSVFIVFYVACLSCLAVRSFQIVCIFKMAAKLPKAYDFWVKHGGQWITIITTTVIMLFLCILWIAIEGPKPNQITLYSEVILDCTYGVIPIFYGIVLFAVLLGIACFSFAYMGTDLPKNYEGKSITFSLLIFFISWVISLTVHLSTKGKHTLSVNPFSVLCSLYGLLLPKCLHNTAAYFQTAIQSYTLQPR